MSTRADEQKLQVEGKGSGWCLVVVGEILHIVAPPQTQAVIFAGKTQVETESGCSSEDVFVVK